MRKRKLSERRLHPRLDKKLPIKIAADGYDFATKTENVSCVGAYAHIDKYVPPFTRISVRLTLPVTVKAKRKDFHIRCNGVIVRTEDGKGGGFNIAIFFNQINDQQRSVISRYIQQFLP